jgi:hypothetical protein
LVSRVILLQNGSFLDPRLLFSGTISNAVQYWFEFCNVTPGQNCPSHAAPVAWHSPKPGVPITSIQIRPGFYKVVLDTPIAGDFERTEAQAYVLLVGDPQDEVALGAGYIAAQKAAENAADETSRAALPYYLYSLSQSGTQPAK